MNILYKFAMVLFILAMVALWALGTASIIKLFDGPDYTECTLNVFLGLSYAMSVTGALWLVIQFIKEWKRGGK